MQNHQSPPPANPPPPPSPSLCSSTPHTNITPPEQTPLKCSTTGCHMLKPHQAFCYESIRQKPGLQALQMTGTMVVGLLSEGGSLAVGAKVTPQRVRRDWTMWQCPYCIARPHCPSLMARSSGLRGAGDVGGWIWSQGLDMVLRITYVKAPGAQNAERGAKKLEKGGGPGVIGRAVV